MVDVNGLKYIDMVLICVKFEEFIKDFVEKIREFVEMVFVDVKFILE